MGIRQPTVLGTERLAQIAEDMARAYMRIKPGSLVVDEVKDRAGVDMMSAPDYPVALCLQPL